MAQRPQLNLGTTLVLIAVLAVLSYAQQHWNRSGGSGGTAVNTNTGGQSDGGEGDRDGGGNSNSNSNSGSGGGNVAGEFDYYALVLSWSPTHCSTPEAQDDETQCARRDGRRYAFVLHGLWPQYERGYPESCRTRARPFVPEPVIAGMLDVMPSRGLIIHEYRKHGTCSGLDPVTYFQTARQLFKSVRIPDRYANPFEVQFVSPDDLVGELVRANPGLKPDMIAVECSGSGNRLTEIRLCVTRDGKFRSCGDNESRGRMCRASSIYVPPVRSTPRS